MPHKRPTPTDELPAETREVLEGVQANTEEIDRLMAEYETLCGGAASLASEDHGAR